MHQNYYDHDESEPDYRRHISNIAFRFKFEVIYEDEQILKFENGETTAIVTSTEMSRNRMCWKAWMILKNEYGWDGSFT